MASRPRRSTRQIAFWTVVLTLMVVTLTVLWNVVIVQDHFRLQELARAAASREDVSFRWITFPIGVLFLIAILIGLLMMGVKLYREVKFSQRQSDFIASVTHEFKTPLAAIRLATETMMTRPMSEGDRQRFLRSTLEDVDRLGRMISNVLVAGKIDLDQLDYDKRATDLFTLLRDYHEERRAWMTAADVFWELEVKGDALVWVDPDALRMVLDNLVENAIKYTEADRIIRLEGEVRLGVALVRVRDNGVGLAADDIPLVFDRFYRGKVQPRKKVPGTGLGLFLARHIARAHGGELTLVSDGPGRGSVALLSLPVFKGQPTAVPEVAT